MQLILLLTVNLLLFANCLYLFAIILAGFINRSRTDARQSDSPPRRLAVLIPAHNEELLIEGAIGSLIHQDYPKDLYTIFVVADNCTDNTASIAKSLGAQVITRTDKTKRGKGYALAKGIQHIFDLNRSRSQNSEPEYNFDLNRSRSQNSEPEYNLNQSQSQNPEPEYEAVVIIDADASCDPKLLWELSAVIGRNSPVAQALYLGSNPQESWRTRLQQIAWAIFNFLRPLGRSSLGFSSGLLGNGMCFHLSLFKTIPWEAFSITEDSEFAIKLLLAGINVRFAPQARLYSQMAKTAAQASDQRLRWERGRSSLLKQFAPSLIKAALKGNLAALDQFLDLLTPPVTTLALAVLLVLGLDLFASPALSALPIASILLLASCLMMGMISIRAPLSLYLALLNLPVYILWRLSLKLINRKRTDQIQWTRTARHKTNVRRPT